MRAAKSEKITKSEKGERGKWKKAKELLPYIRCIRINGAGEEEVLKLLGISAATLRRWKIKYPEFAEAVECDGKKADLMVQEALLKSAVGYTQSVKKVFKLKDIRYDERGKKVETERLEERSEEQAISPSISAQTYWLKTRCPGLWGGGEEKDKEEEESGVVILPEVMMSILKKEDSGQSRKE